MGTFSDFMEDLGIYLPETYTTMVQHVMEKYKEKVSGTLYIHEDDIKNHQIRLFDTNNSLTDNCHFSYIYLTKI